MLATGLLLALCGAIYVPGLSGSFLFDDLANLPVLGHFGPIDDLQSLLLYVFSGTADATGRPLSMLSFLIDARDWPAEPFGFKRTNVCIHIVNAFLLVAVLDRLGMRVGLHARHARSAAVLAGFLWALHPLWVSSVLYIVQRHALLAATFVLCGLRLWLAAEYAFESGRPRRGWLLAFVAMCGCGLAAGLSKPNGFLLPVLALAALPPLARAQVPAARRASRLLLVLPATLLVAGLVYAGLSLDATGRPWTIGERLLTQPRVLLDYLHLLLLPDAYSSGVFADHYRVSSSLWEPPATLPAAALLVAGACAAFRWRRSPWAIALLFFLAGHLLESTVLPLELYFEHRNYLPAALLFWPAGIVLTAPGRWPRARWASGAALIALLACLTWMRASLWGDPLALALNWARDFPQSARAQAHAAGELSARGYDDLALARLQPLFEQAPLETQYALGIANIRCQRGDVDAALLGQVGRALAARGLAIDLNYQWLLALTRDSGQAPCAALTVDALGRLLDLLPETPADPMIEARWLRLRGHYAIRQGRCEDALAAFDRRLDIQRRPENVIEQVGFLASLCSPQIAYRHLGHYRAGAARGDATLPCCALRVREWLMRRNGDWERELDRLDRALREDLGLPPASP
ncbi:MAG: tetratricopeptide repeat protein [Xanthomonadales bacterium]|nr:tetratricopeptide repeat protein [Xanthomonadales bacterium]